MVRNKFKYFRILNNFLFLGILSDSFQHLVSLIELNLSGNQYEGIIYSFHFDFLFYFI